MKKENLHFTDAEKEACMPMVRKMLGYSDLAYRRGLLAFENEIEREQDDFLIKALQMAADATDPKIIENTLQGIIETKKPAGLQLLGRLIIKQGILSIVDGEQPRDLALKYNSLLGEEYAARINEIHTEAVAADTTAEPIGDGNNWELLNSMLESIDINAPAPAPDPAALREAATTGDVQAMWDLAKAYEYGMNGVEKDIDKATSYFQQILDHGDAIAEVHIKLMNEEKGDPETKPLTWDNKRLIARRLQKFMPRTDAMYLSDEHILQIMKDAGLPGELINNIPKNKEHALFGVRYAWAKHAQYEITEENGND